MKKFIMEGFHYLKVLNDDPRNRELTINRLGFLGMGIMKGAVARTLVHAFPDSTCDQLTKTISYFLSKKVRNIRSEEISSLSGNLNLPILPGKVEQGLPRLFGSLYQVSHGDDNLLLSTTQELLLPLKPTASTPSPKKDLKHHQLDTDELVNRWINKLNALEEKIGFQFLDRKTAIRAFTARSAVKESNLSNEQLEFLGDGLLEQVFSELLFRTNPFSTKAQMSHYISILLNNESLEKVAQKLDFEKLLILEKNRINRQGQLGRVVPNLVHKKYMADAFEAFVGAMYIDSNYNIEKVRESLMRIFKIETNYSWKV
jgi:dsRNA-specific ribonuclease